MILAGQCGAFNPLMLECLLDISSSLKKKWAINPRKGMKQTDLSDIAKTEFCGYTDLNTGSKVLAIIKDGIRVDSVGENETALVVLTKLRSMQRAADRSATQV